MSANIENLTQEITELSLKLGAEITPEKTEAKLRKQIEELKGKLAVADGIQQTEKLAKPTLVTVISDFHGKVIAQITEDESTKFVILPGINKLTEVQAEEALKIKGVNRGETT
ncbi:hypothetical protein HUZ36_04570 [Pseudoalteromonas sp. McH1-7]|uniref:hypothetical protein n=1 Tax=Pseudoalteromonas sp. McH1-7 TaxID=2745574 RepID=UPI0015902CC8|nr:hypothetical protein [Pseudoalteromonas sp. McH1-7]NUZ10047.1 hypothetical protein [Pseudoalteromonas sp. McH1-7]